MIVSHGFGEHGGGYRRVAEVLGARLELDVIAVDYRGHGRSPGRRGVVRRYDDLTDDLLKRPRLGAHASLPDLPRFVLAHSNGGQVALRVALARSRLRSRDGRLEPGTAGRRADRAWQADGRPLPRPGTLPGSRSEVRFVTDLLTRDPEIQQEHRADPLRHNRMSPPFFFGMVEGGEMLMARAAEIRTPVLMLLGGQDPVIDPATSREFFDRLGSEDKTLLIYPKMLHEPSTSWAESRSSTTWCAGSKRGCKFESVTYAGVASGSLSMPAAGRRLSRTARLALS